MLEVVGGSKNIYIYNGRHRIFSSSLWSLMICKFVKTLSFISPILQIQQATSPAPLIHPQLPAVDVLRISPSFGASSAVHTARQAPLATAAASFAVSVEAKPQALEVLAMQCGQPAPWATPGGVLRPMSSGKSPLGPKLEVEFHDMCFPSLSDGILILLWQWFWPEFGAHTELDTWWTLPQGPSRLGNTLQFGKAVLFWVPGNMAIPLNASSYNI